MIKFNSEFGEYKYLDNGDIIMNGSLIPKQDMEAASKEHNGLNTIQKPLVLLFWEYCMNNKKI